MKIQQQQKQQPQQNKPHKLPLDLLVFVPFDLLIAS